MGGRIRNDSVDGVVTVFQIAVVTVNDASLEFSLLTSLNNDSIESVFHDYECPAIR